MKLHFLRQEASEVELCCDGVIQVVLVLALCHTLFYATEARRNHLGCCCDRTQVAELNLQVSLSCPTATIAKLLQSQFVCPYLDTLRLSAVVSYTNHDGLNLAQSGVTHDGDAVVGMVLVVC